MAAINSRKFNENHDPATGEFTTSGGGSGNVKPITSRIKPNALPNSSNIGLSEKVKSLTLHDGIDEAYVRKITGGKMGIDDAIAATGVAYDPSSTDVHFSTTDQGDGITVYGTSKTLEISRTIAKDESGNLYVHNNFMLLAESERGKGVGSDIFNNQVTNAVNSGVSYLKTDADKGYAMNGFYTWPRLGYQVTLNPVLADRVRKALPGKFSTDKPIEISDVMKDSDTREWWKTNGYSLPEMKFDLSNGSLSRSILNSYMSAHNSSKKAADMQQPDKNSPKKSEEIDLTSEENALLDSIWDAIGKSKAINPRKPDNIETVESRKFNPNHGYHGYFATSDEGGIAMGGDIGSVSSRQPAPAPKPLTKEERLAKKLEGNKNYGKMDVPIISGLYEDDKYFTQPVKVTPSLPGKNYNDMAPEDSFDANKAISRAQMENLSDSEKEALQTYTGVAFSYINPISRGKAINKDLMINKAEAKIRGAEYIKQMDSAMAKTVLNEDTVLYRGIAKTDFVPVEGKVMTDKGYMSTSAQTSTPLDWVKYHKDTGAVMVIHAPKGTHSVNLTGLSVTPDQQEVLLGRNTRMRILKTETVNGVRFVHTQVLPDTDLSAKFNPNHGAGGLFTSGEGSYSASPKIQAVSDKISKDHMNRLTTDEYKRVGQYTEGWLSVRSGEILRGGDKAEPNEKTALNELDSAIAKGTIAKDSTFYRGITEDPGLAVGQVTEDKAHVSTSLDKKVGVYFAKDPDGNFEHTENYKPALMVIHAKAGSHALHVSTNSVYSEQAEAILPRSSRLRVSRIDKSDPSLTVYHMDLLDHQPIETLKSAKYNMNHGAHGYFATSDEGGIAMGGTIGAIPSRRSAAAKQPAFDLHSTNTSEQTSAIEAKHQALGNGLITHAEFAALTGGKAPVDFTSRDN